MSNSLWPNGLWYIRLPCPSLSPRVCSYPCPLSQWCYLTISSSAALFSSCPQSFPPSESFPVSWLFALGGQNIGASAVASVLPMNIQGWFPLGLTGLISFMSKGLPRVFFCTTIWSILVKNVPWVRLLRSNLDFATPWHCVFTLMPEFLNL